MPEGFAYNPAAIRAFAEVFTQASAQVEQVRATLGDTSARSGDFGNSWGDHGADFERHMGALAADLANLSERLGEVGSELSSGTDLDIRADSTGLGGVRFGGER
jgi:uncharacterized protein YukE